MKLYHLALFWVTLQLRASAETMIGYPSNKDTLSKPFILYKDEYKNLIVFHIKSTFYPKWEHYRIIGKKHKLWYVSDFYVDKTNNQKDSVVKKKIVNSKGIETAIQMLIDIPSEANILEPCRRENKKDSVYEMIDFKLISDTEIYIIEYKIQKRTGVIKQLNPFEAMKICPLVEPRKRFRAFIETVENVY